jgi:Asp/Glu/hydantoin racemase
MKRILLVNPNTNAATTASMLAIAREAAAGLLQIEAMTAPEGVPMITDALALQQASQVLTGQIPELRAQNWDGVITAAYGDPALQALREGLDCPVTGIGEASMLEAAGYGAFAVVTTTPELAGSITAMAGWLGLGSLFGGVYLTRGDAVAVTDDPALLVERLEEACLRAVHEAGGGLASVIIGGGPLAVAARVLVERVPVRLIEPVPAAIRRIGLMVQRANG